MRILTVVGNLAKGGTHRVAQTFAEAYSAIGHDSRVLATQEGGVRHNELARRDITVWIGTTDDTLAAIRAWRPEIIHIHSHGPAANEIQAILSAAPGANIIETNVFSRPSPWSGFLKVSLQLSTWCHWRYAHRAGLLAPSVVLPNAVKIDGFRRSGERDIADFRAKHGIAVDDFVIGRIGQAADSKWSPWLIRAHEHLYSVGIPAKLVVVNAPQSIRTECRTSAHAESTVVIDQVLGDDALSAVYSAIDVFVHVADGGESFGLVLAESLLCETPVVTLSSPWNDNSQAEVVGHEEGGLVATTPKGFLDAITLLARDPKKRRTLGAQGRSRVLAKFDSITLARSAVALAVDSSYSDQSPPRRSTLLSLYRNACDSPSWLTCVMIGRPGWQELTRYTTGYQPWTAFVARGARYIVRRFKLLQGAA